MADDKMQPLPPEGWARVAVTAYPEFKADRIVAEQNFGGDMVRVSVELDPHSLALRPAPELEPASFRVPQ